MPGSGDDEAVRPAGRGRLRASHADREQVIDTLKDAFVQGRLTKDEFDSRVGDVLASRTYANLAALTDDLPAGPPPARHPPQRVRARSRHPENKTVRNGACVIAATTVLAGGVWAGALFSNTDNQVVGALVMSFTLLWLGVVVMVGAIMFESRRQQRSGGELPPAGGQGGRTSKRALSTDPPGQLRPDDRRGPWHVAEAARRGPWHVAEAARRPLPRPSPLPRPRLSPS